MFVAMNVLGDIKRVYIAPHMMISQDEDGTQRCGQLSTFFKSKNGDRWLGITSFQLFCRAWKGGATPDLEEKIIGRIAYQGKWMTAQRVDATSVDTKLVENIRRMGVVVASQGEMALVLLDEDFPMPETGAWMPVHPQPTINKDEKLYTVLA